jgi:hypothetical protein
MGETHLHLGGHSWLRHEPPRDRLPLRRDRDDVHPVAEALSGRRPPNRTTDLLMAVLCRRKGLRHV